MKPFWEADEMVEWCNKFATGSCSILFGTDDMPVLLVLQHHCHGKQHALVGPVGVVVRVKELVESIEREEHEEPMQYTQGGGFIEV